MLAGEEKVGLVAFADYLAARGGVEEGKGGEVGEVDAPLEEEGGFEAAFC